MELTPTLMTIRHEFLREQCEAEAGPVEAVVFARLQCDRCGFVYDLLDLAFPVGWTCKGDLMTGFTDHCRACPPL